MEQHPVPQNVTTFQFRLIGDMTIKQFGYLAGGAILAFIFYKLPLPFFFTWPMTVLCGLLGFGFAFVPIEERPMDVWVLSFLRNVYSPTQFIWHRLPASPEPGIAPKPTATSMQQPMSKPVSSSAVSAKTAVPTVTTSSSRPAVSEALRGLYTQQTVTEKKSFGDMFFGWLDGLFPKSASNAAPQQPTLSYTQTPVIKQAPVVPTASNAATPSSEYLDLQQKIKALEQQLSEKKQKELDTLELQKQMTDTMKQKQYMVEELAKLRKQTIPTSAPPAKRDQPLAERGPTVKIIPPEAATRAGLPRLTTFSNVVTGIVKDNIGGLLPGVLVTVRDKEGVPLRALKTNKLGQFAASTQLPNGTYLVEIEDPRNRYVFDRAQITLNGTVMPAIEIVAKSKRDINREELSKQIFGQTVNS